MSEEIQTNDELTDKINAALEAEPEVTPEVPEMETPEIPSEEVKTEALDELKNVQEFVENSPVPQPAPEGYVPKDKFVASAQESILNAERIRVANETIDKLTKTDTPTDEAMRGIYPEWDNYDDFTKKIVIKTEAQEMRQRRLDAELNDFRQEKNFKWELNSAIESEPRLAGKESEFKRFASNPKNKGISAEVLAKAFLFDVEDTTPAPEVPKTEGLPQGNGGSREPLKTNKIPLAEAAQIRQTDSKRYMELVKADMIDDDID